MLRITFPKVFVSAAFISVGLLVLTACAPLAGPVSVQSREGIPTAEFTCDDVLELTAMQGGNVEGISAGSPANLPGGELASLPPAICFLVDDEPTPNMSAGRQDGLWYGVVAIYAESQSDDITAGLTSAGYAPWASQESSRGTFWYPADLDPDQEPVDGEVFVDDPATMLLIDLTTSKQQYIYVSIGVKAD